MGCLISLSLLNTDVKWILVGIDMRRYSPCFLVYCKVHRVIERENKLFYITFTVRNKSMVIRITITMNFV